MSNRKNYIDKSYYSFMNSSKKQRFDANLEEIENAKELSIEDSESWNDYNAMVVSSGLTGIPNATGETTPVPNQIHVVDLGDGIKRLSMRIKILDDDFTTGGDYLPTSLIGDPTDFSVGQMQKQRYISLHPLAYTADSNFIKEGYNYGTVVKVFYDGWSSRWFITENLSEIMMLPEQPPEISQPSLTKLNFNPKKVLDSASSKVIAAVSDTWESLKNKIANKSE